MQQEHLKVGKKPLGSCDTIFVVMYLLYHTRKISVIAQYNSNCVIHQYNKTFLGFTQYKYIYWHFWDKHNWHVWFYIFTKDEIIFLQNSSFHFYVFCTMFSSIERTKQSLSIHNSNFWITRITKIIFTVSWWVLSHTFTLHDTIGVCRTPMWSTRPVFGNRQWMHLSS